RRWRRHGSHTQAAFAAPWISSRDGYATTASYQRPVLARAIANSQSHFRQRLHRHTCCHSEHSEESCPSRSASSVIASAAKQSLTLPPSTPIASANRKTRHAPRFKPPYVLSLRVHPDVIRRRSNPGLTHAGSFQLAYQ